MKLKPNLDANEYIATIIQHMVAAMTTALIGTFLEPIEFDDIEKEAKVKSTQSQILNRQFIDVLEKYQNKYLSKVFVEAQGEGKEDETKSH